MRKTALVLFTCFLFSFIFFKTAWGREAVSGEIPKNLYYGANNVTSITINSSPETRYYEFDVIDGNIVGEDIFIPAWKLQALLSSLTNLYPGTRPVKYMCCSEYYPRAEIIINFSDGTEMILHSKSQYAKMIPWNIQINNARKNTVPRNYLLFHEDLHVALSRIWQDIEGKDFQNGSSIDAWWGSDPMFERKSVV